MYLPNLRIVHSKIIADVHDREQRSVVQSAFRLLELSELILSETDAYGAFVSQVNHVCSSEQLGRWDAPARCGRASLARWAVDSYLAATHELLEECWDRGYGNLVKGRTDTEEFAQALSGLRSTLRELPFPRKLQEIEDGWRAAEDDVMDAVLAHFVWRCACVGILGSPALYQRISTLLSFDRPFFVVFFGAGCLTRRTVQSAGMANVLSPEQNACMRMIDMFRSLPGGEWG